METEWEGGEVKGVACWCMCVCVLVVECMFVCGYDVTEGVRAAEQRRPDSGKVTAERQREVPASAREGK